MLVGFAKDYPDKPWDGASVSDGACNRGAPGLPSDVERSIGMVAQGAYSDEDLAAVDRSVLVLRPGEVRRGEHHWRPAQVDAMLWSTSVIAVLTDRDIKR